MEEDSQGLIFGKRTVVAMDGGLYEHYPQFRRYLQDAVIELLGLKISKNVIIEHSKDGSLVYVVMFCDVFMVLFLPV
jgi:hexokinase